MNQTNTFNVGAGQTLCIQSGTFTGTISGVASTGTIYISPGATFSPISFNNFGGRFVNCGTATVPGFNFDNNAGLARIENYGVATFTGTYGFNQASTWINGLNSKLTFNNSMVMNNVHFTNNGNVLMRSTFTMNTGTNTFINHDSLTALGQINLNASIDNDGYLFSKGSEMILNASGNITNSCFFVADGGFTYNGQDTLFVTGFTWVTGLNGNKFVIQGKAMHLTDEGFVQGINFDNNNTPVTGDGNLLFTGNTINQGPFGNDGRGLNFYDASPTPNRVFDVQNTLPHATVTNNPLTARDGSFIPNTCSNLIRCNAPTGGAGSDTTACGTTIKLKTANPNDPFYHRWGVVAGNPSPATIDPVTGQVTGMTLPGDYRFRLYKFTNPNCEAIVKVTVVSAPNGLLNVAGSTVCRTATSATVTIINAQSNTIYDAYLGNTLLASGNGANANLVINIPVGSLIDGNNTITFKARRTACAVVDLSNSATVVVSPNQNPSAAVSATSPVCSGGTSTVTIAATKGVTYTVRDQNGNILGTATATAGGPLTIVTSALTATDGPVDYTFTVTASVAPCSDVILTTKPLVTVNPDQEPTAGVTVISPLCSGNTSTVTIEATKGMTYTVRDQNNNVLGTATATTTGNLAIPTTALSAIGAQTTYTISVTATIAGCSDVVLSNKRNIVVNPLLTPSVNLSSSATTICAGTSVTVTATPTNGGTSPLYQWKVNGQNVGSPTTSATYTSTTLSQGDVVSVVLTSNATCATPATVTSSNTVNMTVNPLLTPAVSVSSSATTICAGSSVTVTATPTNGGNNPIYQWRVNGINSGAATTSNTFTSTSLSNGDVVSVVLTSSETCATPKTATSTSNITMTVNPMVTPAVQISAPATTICSGSSVTFTATPTHGGTSPAYQWRVNGVNVSGANSASYTTNTLVNGDEVTVVLTSNANCRTSNTAISNIIKMNIGTNLVPSVNITTPATTICSGNAATFTATVANGGSAPTFQWKINGNNIGGSTSSNTFTSTSLVDGDQVSVTLTSNETCVVTTVANSNVITMKVNPVQPLNASVTAISPICSGSTSTVTIAATKGITYTVRDQDGNVLGTGTATATGDLNIVTTVLTAENGPTTYTFTVTASVAGCADVVLTMKPKVIVNPNQDPSVNVSATSPICSGGTSSIVSVFGTSGMTYTVRDQNGNVIGSGTANANGTLNITTSPLTATTEPVVYTFTITASISGCTDVVLTQRPKVTVNPSQDPAAPVTVISPICSGGTSTVTIAATKGITYTIKDQDNEVLGSAKATSTGPLEITTTVLTAPSGPTSYTIVVTASVDGCNDVELTSKPVILVNPKQDPAALVTATSPICSGGTSVVRITATNGVTYTVRDQNNVILGTRKAASNGPMNITTTVLTAASEPTSYTFTITATIPGCGDQVLSTKPVVVVNQRQDPAATVTATSPICSGSSSVVSIDAKKGIIYTVRDQTNKILGTDTATVTGILSITTDVLTATTNPTLYTFTVTASVAGCSNIVLTSKPIVEVNKTPSQITAAGTTICSNTANATVALTGVEGNVSYQAYIGNDTIGNPVVGPASTLTIPNIAPLKTGNNTLVIKASVSGCSTVNADTTTIVVNLLPTPRILTATSPICEGTSTDVKLTNPEPGVAYTVLDVFNSTTTPLSPVLSAAGSGSYALLGEGTHLLRVRGDIASCAAVMVAEDTVIVSGSLDKDGPVLEAGIEHVCLGTTNTINVTISNTQEGVTYQLHDNGTLVSSQQAQTDDEVLNYLVSDLDTGKHIFTAIIFNSGCNSVLMTSTDSVFVSDSLNRNAPVLQAGVSDVCEGLSNVPSVKLSGTQKGVSYILFDNGKALTPVLTASADSEILEFGPLTMAQGPHKLTVKAKNIGCDSVLLTTTDSVNVNKKINASGPMLKADTNVVCSDGTASLSLTKTQAGVTYVLYQNGIVKDSSQAQADDEVLVYGPYTLAVGTHEFTLTAHNNACKDTVLTAVAVKVNDKPNANNFVVKLNSDVLCSNSDLMVYVIKSRGQDYSYQVIDSTALGETPRGTALLGNNDTLTFGPFKGLSIGEHKIKIVESVQNCASDTSLGQKLIINNSLDTDTPVLSASDNVICENGSVLISITKTSIGDVYRIKDNGKPIANIDSLTAQFTGDTLVFGPIFNLDTGDHVFTATTRNAGCGLHNLKDTAYVRVNPSPDSSTNVTHNGPICLGNPAVVTVAPVRDVSYSLYRGTTLLNGPSPSVLTTTPAKAGIDTLYVLADVRGCMSVRLRPDVYIKVNQVPSTGIHSDTLSTCLGSGISLSLYGTDSNWVYNAYLKVGVRDTTVVRQGGGDVSFAFDAPIIHQEGFYLVDYFIDGTNTGCPTTAILNKGGIHIIEHTELTAGDTIVCEGATYDYTTPLRPGVYGYAYEVIPTTADTLRLASNSIRVTWPTNVTTGSITAYPITNTGICSSFGNVFNVHIEKPYNGNASIALNHDTVCVGQTDTVRISSLSGGNPVFVTEAVILEKIKGATAADSLYVVLYNEPRIVKHSYIITSACAGTRDTISREVVVLPVPIAEAGEYPVLIMRDYPREVVLDGSESSKGNFKYKWSLLPYGNISNSDKIIASFVPEQTLTKVKLTVTNVNGMCPVYDTAHVVIDLGIFIPNVFTPNGDGDHDQWYLENVNAFYPNVKVDIYSKWGTLIYHSDGYTSPWDGTRNSQELPAATYYYVIDLKKPNFKPIAGSVTIIR